MKTENVLQENIENNGGIKNIYNLDIIYERKVYIYIIFIF